MGAMRPTVLLFDIDGTLVTTGGAGRRAISRAFEKLYGRVDACESFSLSGMTDRAIVRKALSIIGAETQPRGHRRGHRRTTSPSSMRRWSAPRTPSTSSMPGMREAVAESRARPGFAVGLGTGNVRQGARVKLRARGHL